MTPGIVFHTGETLFTSFFLMKTIGLEWPRLPPKKEADKGSKDRHGNAPDEQLLKQFIAVFPFRSRSYAECAQQR